MFPIARAPSRARPPPSRPPLLARRLDTARDPAMRERHRLRTPESHEDVPRARGAVPVLSRLVPGPHGRRVSRRVRRRGDAMARDLRRRRRRARARGHSSRQRAKHRGDASRSRESDDDRSVLDRTHPFDRVAAIARACVLPLVFYSATHRPAGVLYGKETPSSRHASTSLCDVHCDDSIRTPTVRRIRASMYKENKENIGHSE